MKKINTAALLAACITASVANGMTAEPFMGMACEAGAAFSEEDETAVLSLSGILPFFNGSVDYYDPWSQDADGQPALRGYLGLGLGPTVQLRCGYGTDEIWSGRLKTTWAFQELKKLTPGFGYAGGESWLGFSSPDGWLTRGSTVSAFAEFREGDELHVGVQFGIIIW